MVNISASDAHVTIIVLTWNSMADIDGCLSSIINQTYMNYEVIVVDSCSNDKTIEHIRDNYPSVRVVPLGDNLGYRQGNNAGMHLAEGEFVVICNDDVEVESDWLKGMVEAMQDEDVGIVTPMILMYQDRDVINASGNTLHYSGMCGPRGKGEPRSLHQEKTYVSAVSGCCFMIRRELMIQLGYFSSDFDRLDTGWHASFEEVDLSWRAAMRGYATAYAPEAVMYHKYRQPKLFSSRFGAYEWGRYLAILRNYSILTIFILLPVLAVQEMIAWAYAFSKGKGHLKAKAGVMRWLLFHPREWLEMRRLVQKKRMVSDFMVVMRLDSKIDLFNSQSGNRMAKVLNQFFGVISLLYYKALLACLRVQDYIMR